MIMNIWFWLFVFGALGGLNALIVLFWDDEHFGSTLPDK